MAAFHVWLKTEIDQMVEAVRKLAPPRRLGEGK
jgi:hypothetical protein